ncbi:MAG: 2-oxoglutarate and iron-dependent oxygenase domain-containing protein [Sphingomonadaceae bacterium]
MDSATVDHQTVPLLSLGEEPAKLSTELFASFRTFGFAMVRDHGMDPALVAAGWDMAKAFFALPEEEKRALHDPQGGGARGYTPFGTEIAKDATVHDLKEFWHVGREGAPDLPANVWPDRPEGFRETALALFAEFDRVGRVLLSHIAPGLGLPRDWFDPVVSTGNSVLRLLHYPPIPGDAGGAMRAGAHEDINLITLLLGAEEAGLELLGKDGRWIGVSPPEGALVVNIGDMMQRLTNHVLPSTTHRVRNPSSERADRSRYSMPFFVHPRSDFLIETLPGCASDENPDRYPEPILADDYLSIRLKEIGLVS